MRDRSVVYKQCASALILCLFFNEIVNFQGLLLLDDTMGKILWR